jgi:catechol 2,3-dioxygenase-like lactoylglutathione lyase family enzyme
LSGYQGPSGVGQIAIPVTDLERAVTFYRDVLGLRFLFRASPGLAFLQWERCA